MQVDHPSGSSPSPIDTEKHKGKIGSFCNTVLEESAAGKVEDQRVRTKKNPKNNLISSYPGKEKERKKEAGSSL